MKKDSKDLFPKRVYISLGAESPFEVSYYKGAASVTYVKESVVRKLRKQLLDMERAFIGLT